MSWTVKNVKSMNGRDGLVTSSTLYRDGKKVATSFNDGNGGETSVDWLDYKATRVPVNLIVADYKAEKDENGNRTEKPYSYNGTPEEKLFSEYANSQTYVSNFGAQPHTFRKNMGFIISELEDAFERAKKLNKKTVFILSENGHEVEYTLNALYTPEVKAHLEEKNGKNLVKIWNTEFVGESVVAAAHKKKEDARLKRMMKTKVVIQLKGDKDYRIINRPYSQALAAQIRVKYEGVKILNETALAEAANLSVEDFANRSSYSKGA